MPQSMPQDTGGLALICAATIALAFKGVIARLAYAAGMSVDTLLLVRFTLALPLFWAGAWRAGARAAAPRLQGRDWRDCAVSGCLFFVAAWCDFHAVALVGAAISRIVLFTFPALVLLLEWAFAGRRPGGREVAAFATTYAGLALVLLPTIAPGGGFDAAGIVYAMGSALSYALFWRRSQGLTRRLGSARFNALANTVTFACMVLLIAPTLSVSDLQAPTAAYGWSLVITVFCTVIPFFLMFEGVRRIGAAEAGLITLFGPAVTVVAAWVILGERLGPLQIAGFLVITAGMVRLRAPQRQTSGRVVENEGRVSSRSSHSPSPGSAARQSTSLIRKLR